MGNSNISGEFCHGVFSVGKLESCRPTLQTFEASRVFEHLTSLGVKPNSTTYSLLVNAHLVNRNPKAALAVIDEMVNAGFVPSKETLKKIRRRCARESDYDSDDQVQSLAKRFNYRMGSENRREMLFNLQYETFA